MMLPLLLYLKNINNKESFQEVRSWAALVVFFSLDSFANKISSICTCACGFKMDRKMKHWLIIIITSLHDGAGLFFFFANLLFNLLFCIFYIYLLVFTSRHLKTTLIPASDNSAVVTGVSNDLGIRWKEKKRYKNHHNTAGGFHAAAAVY